MKLVEFFAWNSFFWMSVAYTREDVNFDFAWRFRLGLHNIPPKPPPPTPAPPCTGKYAFHNKSGVQCGGLGHRTSGDKSPSACEQACCDDIGCAVWQWCDPAKSGCGCWQGRCDNFNNNSEWIGGIRTSPYIPPTPAPWPPAANPDEAKPDFDDSNWEIIDAPHDSLINLTVSQELCPGGCSGRSYIPRYVGWYRKHFKAPASWSGSSVWIYFEGIFRDAIVYLNGKNLTIHDCGYTSFSLRLDNAGLLYGTQENVLVVYVDPNNGRSGWWYEGGGLYRHVRIIAANKLHIDTHGMFVHSHITGSITSYGHPSLGLSAISASLNASALVINQYTSAKSFCVRFSLEDSMGKLVANVTSAKIVVSPNSYAKAGVVLPIKFAELWSIQRPYLYTVLSEVMLDCSGETIDSVSTNTGIRSLDYSRNNEGFFMNGQNVKVRGFCNHNDFASVGMAVPDRINLFRAQAMRSVGGQGWRMSHNPPAPSLLDILDRLGITVMDENRLFANSTEYIFNMGELVKRDRNHPSVIIWSFCNEAGCEGDYEKGGPSFYEITYQYDGSRPTLANMFTFGDLLGNTIDVQGFSHRDRSEVDKCHAQFPHKPLFMSECCSCNTQRGEDSGLIGVQSNFNAHCQQSQTNNSNGVPYVIGTMVWTLFDYYGEPSHDGWPFVSSTFGAFDLAGFAKAAVYWFRSYWLYQIPDTAADKTFSTKDSHIAHIVQGWEPPAPPGPPPPSMNKTYVTNCDLSCRDYNQNISFSGVGLNPGFLRNYNGLCIDGSCDPSVLNCYPLAFVPCNLSKKSQLFVYTDNVFKNKDNGGCLDVFAETGPEVGIFTCNGGTNQMWNITADSKVNQWTSLEMLCLSDTSKGGGGSLFRTIQAYTDVSSMDLVLNGKSLGIQHLVSPIKGGPSWAQWSNIKYTPGNLTAVAINAAQKIVATHSVLTAGAVSGIKLTLDSPSPTTGTGEALFLDGQDAGLVRATVVDAKGELVRSSTHTITFSIVSGPGRVVGTHNGDPQNHENNHAPKNKAYHGLVRAIIMVTEDRASPVWHRRRLSMIDVDGSIRTKIIAPGSHQELTTPTSIVVKATSPGLPSTTITLPVSTNPKDSVLGAAEKFGSLPVYFD